MPASAARPPSPRRQVPAANTFLTALLIVTPIHYAYTQPEQLFITCRGTKSPYCFTWTVIVDDVVDVWSKLPSSSPLRNSCDISHFNPKDDHPYLVNERHQDDFNEIPCVQILVKEDFDWGKADKIINSIRRIRRQTGFSPKGRYRGQTQSQYLAIDHGNGKDEGKAEAHSSADTSRASVSGKSGMGQAQSQTIYDPSCDECYGKPETGPESLQQRPSGSDRGYDSGHVRIPSLTGSYPYPSGPSSRLPIGTGGPQPPSGTGNVAYPTQRIDGITGTQYPGGNGGYGAGQGARPIGTDGSLYPNGQGGGNSIYGPGQVGSPSGTGGSQYPGSIGGGNGGYGPSQGAGPSVTGSSQYPNGQGPGSGGHGPGQAGGQFGPGIIRYPSGQTVGVGGYSPSQGARPSETVSGQQPSGQGGSIGGYGPSQGGAGQNGGAINYGPGFSNTHSGTGSGQYPSGGSGDYSPGQSVLPSIPGGSQHSQGPGGSYVPGQTSGTGTGGSQYPGGGGNQYTGDGGHQYPGGGGSGFPNGVGSRYPGGSGSQYPGGVSSQYPGGTNGYIPGQGIGPSESGQYPNGQNGVRRVYSPGQSDGSGGYGVGPYPSSPGGSYSPSQGGNQYPIGPGWGTGVYSPGQSSGSVGSSGPTVQSGGSGNYIPGPSGPTSGRYPTDGSYSYPQGYKPGDIRTTGGSGFGPIQGGIGSFSPSSSVGPSGQAGPSGLGGYGPKQDGITGGSSLGPVQRGTNGGSIPNGSTYYCCIVGPNGQPQYISGVTDGNYIPLNVGTNLMQPGIFGRNPQQVYGPNGQNTLPNFNSPYNTAQNGVPGATGGPISNTGATVGSYGPYAKYDPNTVMGTDQQSPTGNEREKQNGLQIPTTDQNALRSDPYTSSISQNADPHGQALPFETSGGTNTPNSPGQLNVPQPSSPASNAQFKAETLGGKNGVLPQQNTQLGTGNTAGPNNLQMPSKNGHLQKVDGQYDEGGKPIYGGYAPEQNGPYDQRSTIGPAGGMQFSNDPLRSQTVNGQGVPGFQTDGVYGNSGQSYPVNQGIGIQGPYGQNGYANIPSIPDQNGEYGGFRHTSIDPNAIVSQDTDDSEALASVSQNANGTTASASSKGGNDKGRAQTQVQGTYTGSGSFSAQAQISDDTKGAESQVSGGKQGASSNALGRGRNNTSQADVQLGSETGSLQTHAQSDGSMHSSNSQVQGSLKGGMADAQAKGPGSTSSQAQIGFTPYNEKDKSHDLLEAPFIGEGVASAQSSGRTGQSQSQLQGAFKYGIRYNGAAQSGASLDKDAVFTNRLPFNKIDVFDEANKVINVEENVSEQSIDAEITTSIPTETQAPLDVTPLPDIPFDTSVVTEKTEEEELKHSESRYSGHSHSDHHRTESKPYIPSEQIPAGRRSFQGSYGSNGADYEYTTDKEENPPDDYDPEAGFGADGTEAAEVEQSEYGNYDEYSRDTETHQSLSQTRRRDVVIKQGTDGNTQRIVLGSLNDQDAIITQQVSEPRPDESRIYQPGERVPGTDGYTIPIGFTGSVKAVASKDSTYAIGSKHSPSQAQTVSLRPGSGKIRYTYPKSTSTYGTSVNPKDLRSLSNPKAESDRYVSVSKSVSGALDGENNIRKQYSHTYYTKSSSCGYFTFTCTMVSGTNGKKKVCKPKIPTNPDGTPMRC